MRSTVLIATIALTGQVAFAQNTPIIAYPPQNDTVSMSLSLEDWVTTQTARTELAVDAAMPGGDAGKVRGEILNAVKGLAQGAEWRFTRFDREQDPSGLEHWHAVLEARLPESQLGGLADRAKSASRPGLQIKEQAVDFSPTLAETEATRTKLRGEMYKRVNEALAQLNQAEPDRKYRIENINFGFAPPRPINYPARAAAMPMISSSPSTETADVSLAQKVEMTANVTFAAHASSQ
ncbi:MAG TPA: hypothetical protein VKZ79_15370 [Alphaproteobacteria bacterium]|nr:hypothetical protein [Alphaproteobacteria bacterium]